MIYLKNINFVLQIAWYNVALWALFFPLPALVELSINPEDWHKATRGLYVLACGFCSTIIISNAYKDLKNKVFES